MCMYIFAKMLKYVDLLDRVMFAKNMFVCGFYPTREFFTQGDVTITGEGLQCFFTYARHSWPLSNEDSLACHTYCDTGHPFMMVIPEDP